MATAAYRTAKQILVNPTSDNPDMVNLLCSKHAILIKRCFERELFHGTNLGGGGGEGRGGA